MIITNKMTNRRLNREINEILSDIAITFYTLCDEKGINPLEFMHQHNIHNKTFEKGKFTLAQFIKICYHLDLSPSDMMKRFYDSREVTLID